MRQEIAIDPAALNHRHALRLAGATCHVATNSRNLANSLQQWRAQEGEAPSSSFAMHVLVKEGSHQGFDTPHFRGLKHVVIARFGESNIFTFDLLRLNVTATVTEQLAGNQQFWDRILLPIAMGVLGPALGVVPVHSACLAIDGTALLIAGASGAGKSTLSVALAQEGFDFISDDWTYLSLDHGRLVAHGMSIPAKLLPDAVTHFPLLDGYPLGLALNQEMAYELPAQDLGARVHLRCQPQWFFFLERVSDEGFSAVPVSSQEAQRYIDGSLERLPPELYQLAALRSSVAEHVARLSCWKLSYGGPPGVAVKGLQQFFANARQDVLV
jgi:hypothetical protein